MLLPPRRESAITMKNLADRLSAKKPAGSRIAPPSRARLGIAVYIGLSSPSAVATRFEEFPDLFSDGVSHR